MHKCANKNLLLPASLYVKKHKNQAKLTSPANPLPFLQKFRGIGITQAPIRQKSTVSSQKEDTVLL